MDSANSYDILLDAIKELEDAKKLCLESNWANKKLVAEKLNFAIIVIKARKKSLS